MYYPNIMIILTAMATIELTTTTRMMFFISSCSIVLLPIIALFRCGVVHSRSSSVFFLPTCRPVTYARLPGRKLFLSGSLSCSAKIQFQPATYVLLFSWLPDHQRSLRWVYFMDCRQAALDNRGQEVDLCCMLIENETVPVHHQQR